MKTSELNVKTPSVGAIAFKHNVTVKSIRKQLSKGIKIEKEHTTDSAVAKEIALDHLAEFPDYYDRLEKVEEGPADFSDMKMTGNDVQDSLDYFYKEHAPKKAKPTSLGKVGSYDLVSFSDKAGQLLFLVDNGKPILYLAIEDFRDGVAVGNVRSTGEFPASKFYYHVLKNISPVLYSDKHQTPQGKKLWINLAKHYADVDITDLGKGARLQAKLTEGTVTEVFDDPLDMAFNSTMQWSGIRPGRNTDGMTAEFKTEDGVEYRIDAYRTGKTQAQRDAIQKRRDERKAGSKKFIRFPSKKGGIWEVHFGARAGESDEDYENTGITGSGRSVQVFSTVFDFMKELVRLREPDFISIKSKNAEGNRGRLYATMARKFAPGLGYSIAKITDTSTTQRINLKLIENVVDFPTKKVRHSAMLDKLKKASTIYDELTGLASKHHPKFREPEFLVVANGTAYATFTSYGAAEKALPELMMKSGRRDLEIQEL